MSSGKPRPNAPNTPAWTRPLHELVRDAAENERARKARRAIREVRFGDDATPEYSRHKR